MASSQGEPAEGKSGEPRIFHRGGVKKVPQDSNGNLMKGRRGRRGDITRTLGRPNNKKESS